MLHLVGSRLNQSRWSPQSKTWKVLALFIFVHCMMGIVLTPTVAHGSEPLLDVSKRINERRAEVVKARVLAVPAGVYSVAAWSEEDLNRFGCNYFADATEDVAALLDIVADGQIVEVLPRYVPANKYFHPDYRLGVYLTNRDGSTEKILFEGLFPQPSPVYGTYGGTIDVRAMNPEFAKSLRVWAYAHDPVLTPACKFNVFRKP